MKSDGTIENFFHPKSIAVIGASGTPGKVGHAVLLNLIQHGYKGKIYPVNPTKTSLMDLPCYKSVLNIPGDVDLGIVIVPGNAMFEVVEQCGQKGLAGLVVISAGFKETGAKGAKIEKRLIGQAKKYGMRVQGPNCLGLISTDVSMNASFAHGMPIPGHIAFLSQSGAFCTAVLDWALGNDVGFSKFISLGNKGDLGEVEFIEYLAKDPQTKVILIYQEGVNNGRAFMEAARKVVRKKPIIVLKSGGTAAGARAASSHTGSLAGADRAYECAFKQSGIIRARSVRELFDYARAFDGQPVPKGDGIGIVTNAGGPGIIATDAVENSILKMASFNKRTIDNLHKALPPAAAYYNPVDIVGDGDEHRFRAALELVAKDKNVHSLLCMMAPTNLVDASKFAEQVCKVNRKYKKTTVTSFMGYAKMKGAVEVLQKYDVPNYENPDEAVKALDGMVRYSQWLAVPDARPKKLKKIRRTTVKKLLNGVFEEDRNALTELEAKDVVSAYGLRTSRDILAENIQEAIEAAEEIGYPVVMKIVSPEILHKTDVGGVILGIENAEGVRDSFMEIVSRARQFMPDATILGVSVQEMVRKGREVIIGATRDAQFGPMIMFGLGGIYVEVLKDVAFRIAPLTQRDAVQMVREIRSYPLLMGVRGEPPVDMDTIHDYILRISQMMVDFPQIDQIDLNPLLVHPQGEGAHAIDARFILREA